MDSEKGLDTQPVAPTPHKFDWAPLYDKLLVRRHKPKESYDESGKIAVAETHQRAQNTGVVVAAGEGRLNPQYGTTIPLKVRVGMEVLFGKHSGVDMEDDPELVILREDELLGYRNP
jgi:co-chaperonin GroES (HSP10)